MCDADIEARGLDAFEEKQQGKVHIRVQQRNGRKNITTLQGLDEDLDIDLICKALRKILRCNGSISKTKDMGKVIQLQGDHRVAVENFLYDVEIYDRKDDRIVVYGG